MVPIASSITNLLPAGVVVPVGVAACLSVSANYG